MILYSLAEGRPHLYPEGRSITVADDGREGAIAKSIAIMFRCFIFQFAKALIHAIDIFIVISCKLTER
jgi:hypothetical protein